MNTEFTLRSIVQSDGRGMLQFQQLDETEKKIKATVVVTFDHSAAVSGFVQGKKYAIEVREIQ